MLLVMTETCPGCKRPIDPTDDVVPVEPHAVTRRMAVGAYHRVCLALFPNWERAAANWRDSVVAGVRRSGSVVAQGRGYVAVFKRVEDRIVLYHLGQMADQRFTRTQWRDFAALVRDFDPASIAGREEVRSQLGTSALAVRPTDGRVVVAWIEPVSLEIDFEEPDYDAYVAQSGPLRGTVDFADLAATGQLFPIEVEGSLAKCRGVVRDVRTVGRVCVVTFDAPKRTELLLTVTEFEELRRVVAGVKV